MVTRWLPRRAANCERVVLRFVEGRFDHRAGAVLVVVGVDVRTDVADPEVLRRGGQPGIAAVDHAVGAVKCRDAAVSRNALAAAGKFRGRRIDGDGAADAVAARGSPA